MHLLSHLRTPGQKQPLPAWATAAYLLVVALLIAALATLHVVRDGAGVVIAEAEMVAAEVAPATQTVPSLPPLAADAKIEEQPPTF
jgi:hypothetical protein